MAVFARKAVSGHKHRFVEDGSDLDSIYIADNIIAMGYPSIKIEGLLRNKLNEVKGIHLLL